MSRQELTSSNRALKQRLRDEIDAQIREYLQRGGRIEVINDSGVRPPPMGAAWDSAEDHRGVTAGVNRAS